MNINVTLIIEMGIFLFFVLFTMFFVWPPIIKALNARRARIAEGLAAAEKGASALTEAQAEADKLIAQARDQAAVILRQVNERATVLAEEARENARKEGEILLAAARNEIDIEVRNARETLRRELAGLAISAAGKVLHAELDAKRHQDLLGGVVANWGKQ